MRCLTSSRIFPAISICAGDSCKASKNWSAPSAIVSALVSQMFWPLISTARASARSR